MIDLHCHILPGVDDGPATMGDTLELARAALAAGTLAVVATPHVSLEYPGTTAAGIAAAVEDVRSALAAADIPLKVYPGAELAMTRAFDMSDEELTALRLGGREGSHLLVESPLSPLAAGFEAHCMRLLDRGHALVLAHPERSPTFQREPGAYERLIAHGMLGQVTAGALVGRFGKGVQEYGDHLLRSGLAHDVASDGHSAARRPPTIRPELEEAGFAEQADWLAHEVPYAVLAGTPLPAPPAMPAPKRRSGLGRLLAR